jgi:spore maturation protein CgeB
MKILFVCGEHNYGDARRGTGYEYGNMLPALRALGHEMLFFESWDKGAYRSFADLNQQLLARVADVRPDVVFFVFMNYEIWIETLDAIRERCAAFVVDWAPDDSWKFRESSRYLLDHVDLHCTTYPEAAAVAHAAGQGGVIVTQWAASAADLTPPKPAVDCKIPVSFVGTAYGNRRRWIDGLERKGIEVACFGQGWPSGPLSGERVKEVIRDSVISLNFADSGLVFEGGRIGRSRQIKARTFEVPGLGGFLLTEDADRLADYYRSGYEVVLFRDLDSLVDRIRHFLQHPDERDAIAHAGHARTRAEHTYEKRLGAVMEAVRRARPVEPVTAPAADCTDVQRSMNLLVRAHEDIRRWVPLRNLLVGAARLMFGPQRGPRAARRLVYELYWRLSGERTYRAAGLPGRLFYRES